MNTQNQVDYVIRCTPEQLDEALNNCTGIARRVFGNAHPLSELCEQEAKKWDATSKQDVDDAGQWDSESIYSARALRSFGSKS